MMTHWGPSGQGSYNDGYGRRADYDRAPLPPPPSAYDRGRDWDREPPRRDWDDRARNHNPDPRDRERDRSRDQWSDRRPAPDHRQEWSRGPPPPSLPPHIMDRDKDRDRLPDRDRDYVDRPPHDYRDRRDRMDHDVVPPPPPPINRPSNSRKRDWDAEDRDVVPPPAPYRDHPPPRAGRSDEADWKRRKIDQDDPYAYDNPNQSFNDYEFDEFGHEVNRGPRRRQAAPSEPSQHVIFLGLDPEFTEADLHSYISANGGIVVSVTIIRDRSTGRSRCFGFAQFASIQNASDFVLPNYPFINLPPPSSHITRGIPAPSSTRSVKIDFSQSAQQGGPGGPLQGSRGRPDSMPGSSNDGTRDIGSAPAPVVLLRLLDRNTTIDEIASALRSAEGPGKEAALGMKRIILVIDKPTKMSLGFAFVEFEEVDDAKALLGAVLNPSLHPSGFRISSKPVAISFALPYAFQLLPPKMPRDEGCIVASLAVGGSQEGWTRYWDESAACEEKAYAVPPREKKKVEKEREPVKVKEKEKKGKEKQSGTTVDVVMSEPAAAQPTALDKNAAPVSLKLTASKPAAAAAEPERRSRFKVTARKSTGGYAPRKVLAPRTALPFESTSPIEGPEEADQPATPKEAPATPAVQEPVTTTKVAPLAQSKKVANDINKWNTVQEELSHAGQGTSSVAPVDAAAAGSITGPVGSANPTPATAPAPDQATTRNNMKNGTSTSTHANSTTTSTTNGTTKTPAAAAAASNTPTTTANTTNLMPGDEGFEFGDPINLTCLLCLRQLKSFNQLQRHNNESELHKSNLNDAAQREVAKEKVAAARRGHTAAAAKKKAGSPPGATAATTTAATITAAAAAATTTSTNTSTASDATATSTTPAAEPQQPKYRDRALERRQALNQPDLPIPPPSSVNKKPRYAEGPAQPPPPPAPPVAVGKDASNIGNKMLKKMGWSEGTGLGAEGEGIVDPVKTAVYSAGAGLGAGKAREVTGFTAASYGDAVKESARERFA